MSKSKNKAIKPIIKLGRPSDFTDSIAEEICVRLANGEPLTTICREERMPSTRTVYTWLLMHKTFLHDYQRARRQQSHTFADQTVELANDLCTLAASMNASKANSERISALSKVVQLQIHARQWHAGKTYAKKYGDRKYVDQKLDAKVKEENLNEEQLKGKVKNILAAASKRATDKNKA